MIDLPSTKVYPNIHVVLLLTPSPKSIDATISYHVSLLYLVSNLTMHMTFIE